MKKLVKPVENYNRNEKAVETLCGELFVCGTVYCPATMAADSEIENDIVF